MNVLNITFACNKATWGSLCVLLCLFISRSHQEGPVMIQRRPAAQHYLRCNGHVSRWILFSLSLMGHIHTQVCQTVSNILSWMLHTHPHTNADMNIDSSLNIHTQHIFMKWHLCVCVCVMGLTLAPGLPLWVPCGLSLFFSFSLSFLSFSFSFSLCLSGCYHADTFPAPGTAPA